MNSYDDHENHNRVDASLNNKPTNKTITDDEMDIIMMISVSENILTAGSGLIILSIYKIIQIHILHNLHLYIIKFCQSLNHIFETQMVINCVILACGLNH